MAKKPVALTFAPKDDGSGFAVYVGTPDGSYLGDAYAQSDGTWLAHPKGSTTVIRVAFLSRDDAGAALTETGPVTTFNLDERVRALIDSPPSEPMALGRKASVVDAEYRANVETWRRVTGQ